MKSWRAGIIGPLMVAAGAAAVAEIGLAREIAGRAADARSTATMLLFRATGDLEIDGPASSEYYEAYFHVPIATDHQVPILIEIDSPELVHYRYVHRDPPNVMASATLRRSQGETALDWQGWVLARYVDFSDRPRDAEIPSPEQIPDGIRGWLQPTDCAQIDDPYIRGEAADIGEGVVLIEQLSQAVRNRLFEIPDGWHRWPASHDAFYALQWGCSCTGAAHAAVALFRANGVPARLLHVIVTWGGWMDMHWNAEYWVPDYGWVLVEPSQKTFPNPTQFNVTTFVTRPHDEYPLFYPVAIDALWYSSDPAVGIPAWGRGHSSERLAWLTVPSDWLDQAMAITREVFDLATRCIGTRLTPEQATLVEQAEQARSAALQTILAHDLDGYLMHIGDALDHYRRVRPLQTTTVFFDDFESGEGDWAHHGAHDEWQLGTPTFGPAGAHSGTSCWGTDLDGTYDDRADNWLRSPWIDLEGLASAFLGFWVYNSVEDGYSWADDPLWLDITVDGESYQPLCSEMAGVNDDPGIPGAGGWSYMALDLTRYIDAGSVQIRFRFQSDDDGVRAGAYIDDVEVFGRIMGTAERPRSSGGRRTPSP